MVTWTQHCSCHLTDWIPLPHSSDESTSAVFVFQQIGGNRQHRRSCQASGPVGGQGPWTVAQFLQSRFGEICPSCFPDDQCQHQRPTDNACRHCRVWLYPKSVRSIQQPTHRAPLKSTSFELGRVHNTRPRAPTPPSLLSHQGITHHTVGPPVLIFSSPYLASQ